MAAVALAPRVCIPRAHLPRAKQLRGSNNVVSRRWNPRSVRRGVLDGDRVIPELADADASIEPCLVGWSDKDENGVDVYCCEQPGGAIQCKTFAAEPEHDECEIEEQPDGSLDISCDEDDDVKT